MRRKPPRHLPAGRRTENRRRHPEAQRHPLRRQTHLLPRPALPRTGIAETDRTRKITPPDALLFHKTESLGRAVPHADGGCGGCFGTKRGHLPRGGRAVRRTLADAQGGVERARMANPPLPDGRGHYRAGPQPAAVRRLRDPLCAGLRHRDGAAATVALQYVPHRFSGYAACADKHLLVALSRVRARDLHAAGSRQRLAPARGTYGIPPLRRTPAGSAHGRRVPAISRHPLRSHSHSPFSRSASSGGHYDRVFQPPQRLPRTAVDHLGTHRRCRYFGHPHRPSVPSSLGSPDGGGHLRDRAADAPSFQTVQALRARFGHRHRTGTAAL